MTYLIIHDAGTAEVISRYIVTADIVTQLREIGIIYKKWPLIDRYISNDKLLDRYNGYIECIREICTVDEVSVISVVSGNHESVYVNKDILSRQQYTQFRYRTQSQHSNSSWESRFITNGICMYYFSVNGIVYCLLSSSGDMISIPANLKYWYDYGYSPSLQCIRFTVKDNVQVLESNLIKYPEFEEMMFHIWD